MRKPLFSYRAQISGQIRTIAARTGQRPVAVYKRLYGFLLAFYGIDVYALPRESKKQSWLVVVERHDLLEPLYRLSLAEEIATRV